MIKGSGIFVFALLFISTFQCHHSCSTCTDTFYSSCTTCPDSQQLLKPENYSNNLIGVCSNISISNSNLFGVFLLLIIIASAIVFPVQEVMHFAIFIQSLGLLYLVEVAWSVETHYLLSAFSYLMAFTKINYLFIPISGHIELFKSKIFFKTTSIHRNLSVLGGINLILVLLMIAIPVFKVVRKRINKERANCLPDAVLAKILLCINFAYFMMVQETLLNVYFGMKYGEMIVGDQLIIATYLLSLIFFLINQWFYPFPFFRSKFAQFNTLLMKVIAPIFIISPKELHYLIFVYLIIFLSIDIILTNKNRNNSAINRLLLYKIQSILVVIAAVISYALEIGYNTESISYIIGIFATLSLVGLINLFLIEFCIQYKQQFCTEVKKDRKERQSIEITKEQLNFPRQRIKQIKDYDFTCLPPQLHENQGQLQKSKMIMLPLTLVPRNQQNAYSLEQSLSNTSKLSEKGSSNRDNDFFQIAVPNRQTVETFEEIHIQVKQKADLAQSQVITINNQCNKAKSPPKRKGKKRKREQ